MTYHSTRLDERHVVEDFDCGVESLNRWLNNEARRAQQSDTARVWVWTDNPGALQVRAYFAFAPSGIAREEISGGLAGGQSGLIPGWLLGRLALDARLQGSGLGEELLVDAIGRIAGAAQAGSGRVVIVDAVDDNAALFYAKYGFIPVKHTPNRLVIKLATIHKAIGLA